MIARHRDELAAVLIEPMIGSGGGISADREFLAMLRDETRRHGIILIFDEVMTSRLSPGGLQEKLGIVPDMTSFGKYLGGGLSFGAFGGARRNHASLRSGRDGLLRPFRDLQQQHAHDGGRRRGARVTSTPRQRADDLNARGDRLREMMNAVFRRHGVAMQMLGQGSLNVVHVHGRPVRRPADVANDPKLQALFHLEMLERGIYLARRGLSALCLPLEDADVDRFVEAVDDFCAVYRPLLLDAETYRTDA